MKTYIVTFEVKVKYVAISKKEAEIHAEDHKFFLDMCWAGNTGHGRAHSIGTSLISIEPKEGEKE
jgi:hypothetical protein